MDQINQLKNNIINALELSEEEVEIFMALIKEEKTSSANFKSHFFSSTEKMISAVEKKISSVEKNFFSVEKIIFPKQILRAKVESDQVNLC